MAILIEQYREVYLTPAIRVIDAQIETAFLASNLEPIDGGDGEYIDW